MFVLVKMGRRALATAQAFRPLWFFSPASFELRRQDLLVLLTYRLGNEPLYLVFSLVGNTPELEGVGEVTDEAVAITRLDTIFYVV